MPFRFQSVKKRKVSLKVVNTLLRRVVCFLTADDRYFLTIFLTTRQKKSQLRHRHIFSFLILRKLTWCLAGCFDLFWQPKLYHSTFEIVILLFIDKKRTGLPGYGKKPLCSKTAQKVVYYLTNQTIWLSASAAKKDFSLNVFACFFSEARLFFVTKRVLSFSECGEQL